MTYSEAILSNINSSPGITEGALQIKLMSIYGPNEFDENRFNEIIYNLIAEKQIIILRYKIGLYSSALYFPKDTIIHS